MHIVQMINALRVGGAEKLVVTFSQAVQDKDVRLTVVTLRPNQFPVQAEVESTGAEVAVFNHRKIQAPGRFKQLTQFLRRERPDIIHAHLAMATILGAASGALARVPVVASLHNTVLSTSNKLLLSSTEEFVLRHMVKRVIAVGWQTAQIHEERLGTGKITVIPNAVSIPEPLPKTARKAIRTELTGDPNRVILLFVGRLEPQKGLLDLVESFSMIHKKHPEASLVIAGSGSLERLIQARVQELGLQAAVHLLGLRQDVPDLMAASDIFVSAAHWEGLPVASLEAMAAGLPPVVTAAGDLPRVILPGMGLLVPPKDSVALAAAIESLLEKPDLRWALGTAAREHITRHYNASAWADRLIEVYAEIIAKKTMRTQQVQT